MRTLGFLALAPITALGVSLLASCGIAEAASFSTLYRFTGQNGDGSLPEGNLAVGKNGVLYGTTFEGGVIGSVCPTGPQNPGGCGTVFKLTPPATAGEAWIETVLYRFTGENGDGANPTAGVVIGPDGLLYGTTIAGGSAIPGGGTVFQLAPPAQAGGAWIETVLHSFTGQNGDGSGPEGYLAVGGNGALYGMTTAGGPPQQSCLNGCGIVFELAPPAAPGEPWREEVLYTPSGQQSDVPAVQLDSGLTIGEAGALYGVTPVGGGPGSYGTVFKLTPPAIPGVAWKQTVLLSFNYIDDGASPMTGVVIGNNGALYGTTTQGGLGDCPGFGCGTVFQLAPPAAPGEAWTESVLCSMGGVGCYFGGLPATRVVIGKNGVLFGTTIDQGVLFAVTPPAPSGGVWTSTQLHTFNGTDGSNPSGLAVGENGVVYGTTFEGGSCTGQGCGTVFAWTP